MEKEKSQKIQIDFLLTDFNSIKAEMSQRAGLQKTAHLLYLAGVAWIFSKIVAGESSGLHMISAWFMSSVTMIFIHREGLEIGRLAEIIRGRICKEIKKISGIDEECLVPSEYSIKSDASLKTKILNDTFNFILFFAVPFTILIMYCFSIE